MNYQDVIKDSKFYLPMNLNLVFLLKDTEIVMLMHVINCDNIHEKLSVRKLMRYSNKTSNRQVQDTLKTLRELKLIEGFKPNYNTLKYVFDSLNNAKSIEERKNWCKAYSNRVQQSVPNKSTQNCTQIEYTDKEDIEKEDVNKKDLNISNKNVIIESVEKGIVEWEDVARGFKQKIERTTTVDDFNKEWEEITDFLSTNAESIPSDKRNCFNVLLDAKNAKIYSFQY